MISMIKGITTIPGKRSQKYVEYENGVIERRCMAPHNPHFRMTEDGLLVPINIQSIVAAENSKVGGFLHRKENVVSVGIRGDNNPYKYLGLRPDVNQAHGTEQLEFSLQRIVFDGEEQSFDLSQNKQVHPVVTDLGSIQVFSNRQRARQMVKVTKPLSSFRIEFIIHLKGLRIESRPELNEYWVYSIETGEFRYRIRPPYLVDAATYEPLVLGEFPGYRPKLKHSLKDNGDGTYTYIKESDEDFSKLTLPDMYLIDADTYYSSTADGHVGNTTSFPVTWGETRNAETGTSVNASSSSGIGVYSYLNSLVGYRCWRVFLYFDTSGASNPESGYLYLTVASVSSSGGTEGAYVCPGFQADTLTTADYDAFDYIDWGNNASTFSSVNTKYGFELTSAGVSGINTSGTTKICVVEAAHDWDNTAPTVNKYTYFYSTETGTGDKDPYLSITEGAAATFIPRMITIL